MSLGACETGEQLNFSAWLCKVHSGSGLQNGAGCLACEPESEVLKGGLEVFCVVYLFNVFV